MAVIPEANKVSPQMDLHEYLSEGNFLILGSESWKLKPSDATELNKERLEFQQAKGLAVVVYGFNEKQSTQRTTEISCCLY